MSIMHKQEDLFPAEQKESDKIEMIGRRLSLTFNKKDKNLVTLKNYDIVVRKVDLSDKVAKKIFVTEAVELGANQSRLSDLLGMSRQTIHNYTEIKKKFGTEGLLAGYNTEMGKNLAEHRKDTQGNRIQGNKAVILAEERKANRLINQTKEPELDFTFGEESVSKEDQAFNGLHDWKFSRYAGIFPYLIVLINENQWLKLVMGYFGSAYKIFLVFLLMAARNIKSIEQLKNINQKEAGLILGLNRLPNIKNTWLFFYAASNLQRSIALCKAFFKHQILSGLVGINIWFTDGHLLPYSGKEKVHLAFNTQRKMVMPGQTNMVACDITGRIVDFQIQEGTGDLKSHIVHLKQKWDEDLTESPVMVFDREGYGAPFFSNLIENKIPFVTWEKHVDLKELNALEDSSFNESFEMNNKSYSIFEGEKTFTLKQDDNTTQTLTLRRIYLWNKTSKRRTCGLAWDAGRSMSTIECAQAILSRWGASENTFKHLYDRHPFHYHPGFTTVESENQLIANPAVKSIDKEIKTLRTKLDKIYKKCTKAKDVLNKDGSKRENSLKARLESEITLLEEKRAKLLEEKKQLPERIDVTQLQDYSSFNKIDNEGKNLFDFVTASVWNARKSMTEWLLCHYPNQNEYVDLFYTITQCHGWIKSEADRVVVRLEPLQQPSRRKAQEQFCNRLNALNAYIPIGKKLLIEVGPAPI